MRTLIIFCILGAGIVITLISCLLLYRRHLGSSGGSSVFVREKAVINAPIPPGAEGTALVRQFGKETELCVRCKNKKLGFIKGTEVRIVAYEESVYWIEPL
ncbi:MAG: hypothetical protein LBG73_08635 [Spirochaetaceae bacterium]|jgi:hypothetical protein|nr:hypothetical protein [Spirochaetaceae bacterium]